MDGWMDGWMGCVYVLKDLMIPMAPNLFLFPALLATVGGRAPFGLKA